MKLAQILKEAGPHSLTGNPDIEITGLTEDSRTVEKGSLFFARAGKKTSGLDFISQALSKGAAAVVAEEDSGPFPVPVVKVPSITEAETKISEVFYDHPSRHLTIVGVTGTNGKTTFTYLLEAIAMEAGWRTAVIGTVNYRMPKDGSYLVETFPAPNTTPNILHLQKVLHQARQRKVDLVAMEVSSHALALGRVAPIEFDGGVFTNLTQDHLDFHGTLDQYFEEKLKLFKKIRPGAKDIRGLAGSKAGCEKFCIINLDDAYGKKIVPFCHAPVMGYAIDSDADFRASDAALEPGGTRFTLQRPGGKAPVRLNLIGRHNVYNALAAIAAADRLLIPFDAVVRGLENIRAIPGRLESIQSGQDFTVLVDYAHTEDALRNVLESLRQLPRKRILTLFGCGGDRDRSKRPLMGAAAVQLSDHVIVTSDNPRSEDPEKIALDIEVGIHRTGKKNYEVILDREKAIGEILKRAKKGDVVLIAGKGHEDYQIFKDKTIHFDDRETARRFLSKS